MLVQGLAQLLEELRRDVQQWLHARLAWVVVTDRHATEETPPRKPRMEHVVDHDEIEVEPGNAGGRQLHSKPSSQI